MEQDSEHGATRVSLETARAAATRLRAALAAVGLPPDVVRQVIPWDTAGDHGVVRLGTWTPDTADRLASALEQRAPLIGHRDAAPALPTARS
jgi:hypothetical protein